MVAEIDHSELDATILEAEGASWRSRGGSRAPRPTRRPADAGLGGGKAALQTVDAETRQSEILLADAQRRLRLAKELVASLAVVASEVDDRLTEVAGIEAKIIWTKQRRYEAEQQIAVAQSQAAAARAAVAAAEARQRSAEARVKVLESQREESFIRSPFDGVVTEKAAEVGEIVAPISIGGSMARGSIVTIADWASLQAEVDVAESQLGRVQPGQRAAITVDAIPGKVFPGKVRRIQPRPIAASVLQGPRDFHARDEQAILPKGLRVRSSRRRSAGLETGAGWTRSSSPRRRSQPGQAAATSGRQQHQAAAAHSRPARSRQRIEIISG